jgi:hypothetical protein
MRQWMRTIARHWVSPVLFTLYWLAAMGMAVEQLLTGPGNISQFNLALLILVPVLAGGLIAFLGGWIAIGGACGAAFAILDFALLLNLYLLRFPPAPGYPSLMNILVPLAVPGAVGGLLGLAGAFAARFFGAKWDRSKIVLAA